MEESQAIIGILFISAIAIAGFFVITGGGVGAAISQSYVACCCNILTVSGPQVLVRNQIQTFAGDCNEACKYYEDAFQADHGVIFPQEGFCAANP